ncbi:Transposon TX1 uncharacterized 149 kDa protein [Vitis vinifera]|uniref:Transposon TX1 uncharacterized 149 kDa protein n=1 Tax=Vitis vinifera TaxID=29760 RepID=A0A438HHB2_VITVI|nr:Transposon TX1 uncharacterized 149 kDa protein [Vitis vinifera]
MEEDLALWKGGKNGKFEVKEAYELLISHSTLLFPKKGIWVENVPSKLAFFAWEATWGRVLTLDRLQKRGWQLPNRCYLCGMDEENVNHLLIHCTVARVLWGIVLGLVGAQWVFPESVKEWCGVSLPYRFPGVDSLQLRVGWFLLFFWRNRKYIKELENERGLVLNNAERITEEILLYFEKLYVSPIGESWSIEGLDWSPISEESAIRLDSLFTEEEIFKAIFQLDRDKAPGLDGFTIAVFQDCWDVIKEDLVRVFAEFHRSGVINQNTNASFIVLLPKKSMTKKISDFRPISLITSFYKIIAKVLSGRLRGVLHETIHSTQGAFVQGRQILDLVLIANEIVDERRRSGEEGVVFKIDFEKAYDHVRWDFLDQVLEKKGFNLRWRKWMSGCLSSVSYAVMVNGSAKGFPSKFVWNSQVPFKVKSFVWGCLVASCEHHSYSGCVGERNARIFEDKARNSEYLWDSIVFLASLWAFVPRMIWKWGCDFSFQSTVLGGIGGRWQTEPYEFVSVGSLVGCGRFCLYGPHGTKKQHAFGFVIQLLEGSRRLKRFSPNVCIHLSGFRETHIRGYIEAIREIEQQLPTGTDEVGFDDIVVACGRKRMHMNYCHMAGNGADY